MLRRNFMASIGAAAWTTSALSQAQTSAPASSRAIRIIVPFPPGGGVDITARLLAEPMAAALGQSVIVDNRTGASGSIGAGEVARAAPDGNTLLMDSLGHVVNPAVLQGLPFDYSTAFVPISKLLYVPQMVIVHPDLPVRSLKQLVEYVKARPGQSYGSAGVATASHLCSLLLTRNSGMDMVHVPYRGGPLALQDLLGNRITMMVSAAPYTLPMVKGGKVRVLAVTTRERIPSLPDVPTFAEEGFGAAQVSEWNGLFAPAGTPPDRVQKLYEVVRDAVATPAIRNKFDTMGYIPAGSDPSTFAKDVRDEREVMRKLVKDAGVQIG
jgi:tripartite-type tricarboxylate transporter receptor subunit TctC